MENAGIIMWQDMVLMIVGFLFGIFLLPMLYGAAHGKPVSIITAFTTSFGLFITAYTYLSLDLVLAMSSSIFSGTIWFFIGFWSAKHEWS